MVIVKAVCLKLCNLSSGPEFYSVFRIVCLGTHLRKEINNTYSFLLIINFLWLFQEINLLLLKFSLYKFIHGFEKGHLQ